MKIKCRKIKGIDKAVCTAEQKIAYNYAFKWADIGKSIIKSSASGVAKSQAIFDIENLVIKSIKEQEIDKKYNIDGIIIAFRQGFEKYCENFFIATSYEQIGKTFVIPYEIV